MQVRAKVQAFISSKKVNQGVIFVGGWSRTHPDLGYSDLFLGRFCWLSATIDPSCAAN